MTEDMKAQASGAQDGATGTPATQVPATDADWKAERIKAQRQAKAAIAEAESLKAKLAEFENAKKTEQEKAVESAAKLARESAIAEMQGTILQKEIRNEIRLKLAEAGVPANQTAVILDESKPETIEDAAEAASKYAENWKATVGKPATPAGVSGSPTGRSQSTLTLADVRKMSREEYMARGEEINEGIASGRIR